MGDVEDSPRNMRHRKLNAVRVGSIEPEHVPRSRLSTGEDAAPNGVLGVELGLDSIPVIEEDNEEGETIHSDHEPELEAHTELVDDRLNNQDQSGDSDSTGSESSDDSTSESDSEEASGTESATSESDDEEFERLLEAARKSALVSVNKRQGDNPQTLAISSEKEDSGELRFDGDEDIDESQRKREA